MTRGAGLNNRRREKREDPGVSALEECCKCLTKDWMSITKPVMYWHSKIKTTYLLWESDYFFETARPNSITVPEAHKAQLGRGLKSWSCMTMALFVAS